MSTFQPPRPWIASYAAGVPEDLSPVDGSLVDIVAASARDYPDAPALQFFGRETTYAQLQSAIERAAAGAALVVSAAVILGFDAQSGVNLWHAPLPSWLLGGIGIISTFAALLIVVLLPIGGLRITDALGWILGPVVVWIITALCTVVLPLLLIKREVREAAALRAAAKKR